jgi:hypothetical protein
MQYSFRVIRFGFIVGIGGDISSEEHDVRLSDIVINKLGKQDGKMI